MRSTWAITLLLGQASAYMLALDARRAAVAPTARAAVRCTDDAIESPFEAKVGGARGAGEAAHLLEFTVANVDQVLEQVRPYLISDGGNVEVVSVDPADMSVQLQLQGACGSCPSSTVTMKMGIERILRENWADVGDVVDIGGAVEAPAATLSIETAHEALSTILPAIAAMGGSVRIVSAAEAHVVLEYTGPEKVKMGIELALKDSPLIDTVEFA